MTRMAAVRVVHYSPSCICLREYPHAPITVSTQTLDDTVQFLETATFQWMSR